MLARKCAELEKLKGSGGELQLALKLLEEAQQEAAKLDAPAASASARRRRPSANSAAMARRTSQRYHVYHCAASSPTRTANAPRATGR